MRACEGRGGVMGGAGGCGCEMGVGVWLERVDGCERDVWLWLWKGTCGFRSVIKLRGAYGCL